MRLRSGHGRENGPALDLAVGLGLFGAPIFLDFSQPADRGLIGRCLRERRPVLAADVTSEPDHCSGYPDGLAGEQIPLGARIVFACDTYDAMTTDRSYRAALAPEQAKAELRRVAGGQLDPTVVEALIEVLG